MLPEVAHERRPFRAYGAALILYPGLRPGLSYGRPFRPQCSFVGVIIRQGFGADE